MFRFFRTIRQNLLAQNRFTRYLVYALGEILLVVIGILIALQINTWNEGKKSQAQELATMKEIIENLNYDIGTSKRGQSNNVERLIGLDSLRTAVSATIRGQDETVNIYYFAMKYGQDYNIVTLIRSAYDQLVNSGTIQHIKNRKLVHSLSDYYERKSSAVLEYEPKTGFSKMKATQRKFIQYRSLDKFVQSFDTINENTFDPEFEYSEILMMNDLQLLKPNDLSLDDYYNEISQFEMDLKTYNFYISWPKEAAETLIADIEQEYRLKQQ
jgi:hypothetical protein